jgi:amidase
MHAAEYLSFDAVGLANLIAGGGVSRQEVLEAAFRLYEERNPSINAVIEFFDAPLAAEKGALDGVPFLFKDLGGLAEGVLHEYGSRLAKGQRGAVDSRLTERYREAGLAILGRCTTPEMAFNITTESLATGPTRNPWDLSHSVGGSSGGSAAAVAAGIVPIAQANDGAGSIRIPAAACGLVGLKPTRGRISEAPFAGTYLSGLSASHVVSRTVRDTAVMLDLTGGPEPGDPYLLPAVEEPYGRLIERPARPLRIGLQLKAWSGGAVDDRCIAATRGAAKLLADLGHHVDEVDLDLGVDWPDICEANARIWCADTGPSVKKLSEASGRPIDIDHVEAAMLACYHYGIELKASELLDALSVVNMITRQTGRLFQSYDVMLTPTLPEASWDLGRFDANDPAHDALTWTRQMFDAVPFTPLFNMTGQPAISVPWDLGDGGPGIGIQLAGRFAADGDILQLAADIERAHPWNKVAPCDWTGT